VAAWCRRAVDEGRAVEVAVEGAGGAAARRAYAVAAWRRRAAAAPAAPERVRLLSPFDPVLRDRKRALRLFNFEYRFEAFVPAPRRRFGYFVLPVLEGERLIGRLDPSLDRESGVLRIRGPWWEPGVRINRARRAAFDEGVARFAGFVGARRWAFAKP
jgi:uncharacterized protein